MKKMMTSKKPNKNEPLRLARVVLIATFIRKFIPKSCNHKISKANNADNTSNDGPVSKNHKNPLEIDDFHLTNFSVSGQSGFSLVEVLIAASLLSVLSYFGMELMETMKKNQKTIEARFNIQTTHSEISSILSRSDNCTETFNKIDIKALNLKFDELKNVEIESLKKVSTIKNEDETLERLVTEKFSLFTEENKKIYAGNRILNYSFLKNQEDTLEENSINGTLTFRITYKPIGKSFGNPTIYRDIPITFTFDQEDTRKMVNCVSSNSSATDGSPGAATLIDPIKQKSLEGKTGEEACANIGLTCTEVISQNYASKVYGQEGLSNLCQISYNMNLAGVTNGSPISNNHSCKALIGIYDTYQIDKKDYGVSCQGIFKARCF